ncbi:MAG: hypothetical protein D6820_02670, partial [Lentisphaerae bacterium]
MSKKIVWYLFWLFLSFRVMQAQEEAVLSTPYEHPAYLQIPFGAVSLYMIPWRGYMDTWPAGRFLGSLGCVGLEQWSEKEVGDTLAKAAVDAGIDMSRIEIAWSHFSYYDPTRLKAEWEDRHKATLLLMRRHGLRPLILLNGNHGNPCPSREHSVNLLVPAKRGDRQITIDSMDGIRPHYTGLAILRKTALGEIRTAKRAFPLITRLQPHHARFVCTLSAPLPMDLDAGPLTLYTLKYHPFSAPTFANGMPNPMARETLDGWKLYVKSVCEFAFRILGNGEFDLEVWNEYSFGSDFLFEDRYYNPPRKYRDHLTYANHGRTYDPGPRWQHEIILPITVDLVRADPRFSSVRVINGFASQRPWDAGWDRWPGQWGMAKHYYSRLIPDRRGGIGLGILDPRKPPAKYLNSPVLNESGRQDSKPPFIPELVLSMPEAIYFAFQT